MLFQFQALVEEAMHHATMFNISAYNAEATELSTLLTKLITRTYSQAELDNAFNFNSFSSVLERIGKNLELRMNEMLSQRYGSLQ